MKRLALLLVLLLPAAAGAAVVQATTLQEALRSITAPRIRAHLAFLADDLLEGRAPGTRGGQLAARYIATQLASAGVQPVRDRFLHDVPFAVWTADTTRTSIRFEAGDRQLPVRFGPDVVAWPGTGHTTVDLSADVVFVGYGVRAPEYGWDDYKGRDVRGRVLLVLVGDPPSPPTEPDLFRGRELTYYGRWSYKVEEARRQGAAGIILMHDEFDAGYPWNVVRASWSGPQYSLRSGTTRSPLRFEAWLSELRTRALLDAVGRPLDQLRAAAARRDFTPQATGLTVDVALAGRSEQRQAPNVIGMVPGSDPQRRRDVVVYTAHYDHLGIGRPVVDDSVYNGAYDNASGVAALIEMAAAFARLQPAPARTTVFLFTTGEEAGLLGSRHFVRQPPLPDHRVIANINIDGANLWGETDDYIGLGGNRSTLGSVAQTRGRELGMAPADDPAPEIGLYFRSDHFPFALAGIPAIQIMHGERYRGRPEGWGTTLLGRWNATRYHLPADEYDPAFDLAGAVQQARLAMMVGYDVAQSDSAPRWLPGRAPGALPGENATRD